ncbi:hypothetical protein [Hyphococcus sp.]|uniref:hypothetical protein n=1 Tax=Hyphococcus sp. TaxID=2038636 RepID=UPI00207F4DAE|nr:MAG: hypothetical protein DHS20C04_01250 [Marinicaulis sp.]
MNRLSTLGALIAGAILLAAIYGAAFSGRSVSAEINMDDGEGVRQIVNGDKGSFSLRKDGLAIKATWRGEYELSADGNDIASLEHKLEISRDENGATEKVVFEDDNDEVKHTYYRNGDKQSESDESRAAASALLVAYLEASGAKAKERVAIILREGGPDAVINKIGDVASDHARLRYVTELTEQTELTPGVMQSLLATIKSFEGDHDIRSALDAILKYETVQPAQMPLFLEAARRIEGDYDLRRLIESVSEKPLNEDAVSLAVELMQQLESDHDLRRAGEALLTQDALSDSAAARLLNTIGDRIESDHDLRLLLGQTTKFLLRGEEPSAAWIKAFGSIESDHDQRLALEDAAKIKGAPEDVTLALINATATIESGHDRRLALETFADRAKTDQALLDAYKASARGIESDSDRERAFNAAGLDD